MAEMKIDAMERFNNLPEREQKLTLARAWIMTNDHFLFPLEGETDLNHHARILTVYAAMYHASLTSRVEALETKLQEAVALGYAQALEWDRYWKAAGVSDGNISVDEAIELFQSIKGELHSLRQMVEGEKHGK
jgi:hypothetical protein